MKRVGNLYPRIADLDNLQRAYLKAVRGKRMSPEVIAFGSNLAKNLAAMLDELERGTVQVGDYRFFTVHDPKLREICAASFRERVLHHAIMNLLEPVLERYAISYSYACRRGKGGRKALARARRFCRDHAFYLKLDIRKYFDSIEHERLLGLLEKRVKDKRLLALVSRILATYNTTPGRGVPIGNLVSQHMANFYLGFFDHWIKDERSIKGYVRYMDDFLIFGDRRGELKSLLAEIRVVLSEQLGLVPKDNVQLNRCSLGIPFLGYRVFAHGFALLPRSKKRFVTKFREYEQNYREGRWDEGELAAHVTPLVDFVRFGDKGGWRKDIMRKYGVHPEARTA